MSDLPNHPPPPPPSYGSNPAAGFQPSQHNYNTQYGFQSGANLPPPPPPGVPVAGAPGVVVVTTQPMRIFTRHPTSVICQHCNQNVVTRTRSEVGMITWLSCGAMIIFGLWLGCCLIPFCIPDLQDTYHECPNCNNVIQVYKPV